VTHLSAKVCRVDRRLFAGWELMPQHLIIVVHALLIRMPPDSQE
jgi:hypothetical protein